jgi:hypothetical protein
MTDVWNAFTKKTSLMIPSKKTTTPVLSDYRLEITGDKKGVHISALCHGNPVDRFSLLKPDYLSWKKMTLDQQHMFVRTRLSDNAYGNNIDIINSVVSAICTIINGMFKDGQRMQQRRR